MSGCSGVSQEDYDAVVASQKQSEERLTSTQKELESQKEALDKAKSELSDSQKEVTSLQDKLTLYRKEANPAQSNTDNYNGTLEEEYINNFLTVYDFQAKYFDSWLDGKIPGVTFKIKNKGNKTLSRLEVAVYFKDSEKKNIAEESYLVVYDSIASDYKELKPNYVYQLEKDKFYTADTVPKEWKSGNAEIKITQIEFKEE